MGWAFLTRAGSESDLIDELRGEGSPTRVVEGVVLGLARPRRSDGHHRELTFARQAMRVEGRHKNDPEALAAALAERLTERDDKEPFQLQIVVPDSKDPKDPRRKVHSRLGELLPKALDDRLPPHLLAARMTGPGEAPRLLQVWILDEKEVLYGLTPTKAALSPHPGGKLRLKRPDDALSRSGLKLEEAIGWIGVGPEKGDLCVDLGAAPGGWSQVALGRGAAVVAVDPAHVKLEDNKKRFTHLQESAFTFVPPEAMDWVLCDMAWRPLEVAQLLAKWARRGWARQLLANFKLPMKQKARILEDILQILGEAGWEGLRARQLYHDRDEITVFAWLNAGIVARGWQPAFELRAHKNRPEDEDARRPAARRDARSLAGRQGRAAHREPERRDAPQRKNQTGGPAWARDERDSKADRRGAKPGPRGSKAGARTARAGTRDARAGTRDARAGTRDGRAGTRDARDTRDTRAGTRDGRAGTRDARDTRDTRTGTRDARTGTRDARTGTREARTGARDAKAGPRGAKAGPRGAKAGPRGAKAGPRGAKAGPRGAGPGPRGGARSGPRRPTTRPRGRPR